jgi:hypothetical protein
MPVSTGGIDLNFYQTHLRITVTCNTHHKIKVPVSYYNSLFSNYKQQIYQALYLETKTSQNIKKNLTLAYEKRY